MRIPINPWAQEIMALPAYLAVIYYLLEITIGVRWAKILMYPGWFVMKGFREMMAVLKPEEKGGQDQGGESGS